MERAIAFDNYSFSTERIYMKKNKSDFINQKLLSYSETDTY